MAWACSSKYRRRWRRPSIADANRHSVSWSCRVEAQDLLDELTFQQQKVAAEAALGRTIQDPEIKTRPQRGPLHTRYPAFSAARACAGLSAMLEFMAHAGQTNALLIAAVRLPPQKLAGLDPAAVSKTAGFVAKAVATRLCIDQLVRFSGLGTVESYRLFAANMIDLRFHRLADLILGVVTLGDLISGVMDRPTVRQKLHPLIIRILEALSPACHGYEEAANRCRPEQLPALGLTLAQALMNALVPFLPIRQPGSAKPPALSPQMLQKLRHSGIHAKRMPGPPSEQISPTDDMLSQPLAGVDDKLPPTIDGPEPSKLRPDASFVPFGQPPHSPIQMKEVQAALNEPNRLRSQLTPAEAQAQALLRRAVATMAQAASGSRWDDPRVDQVAHALSTSLFDASGVEAPLGSHRFRVTAFGSGREGGIHEEVLPRCRNRASLDKLRRATALLEKRLRSFKWFGRRNEVTVDRLQDRGALDPGRLYRLASSPLICRRWQQHRVTDYHGKPVVILAKDGSSSNTHETTFAGKILVAAFLRIARLARIEVFAADYSSDSHGHLVSWLHHPEKTPGRSSIQAADAAASLPAKGRGGNEDVLSLSHVVREALKSRLTHKQTVILINVTDGKFNSPLQEVRSMVRKLREETSLSYSLVILGNQQVAVPEADYTVRIPAAELKDPALIATHIAAHVNALVRELRERA